jgi:hypothetical protein
LIQGAERQIQKRPDGNNHRAERLDLLLISEESIYLLVVAIRDSQIPAFVGRMDNHVRGQSKISTKSKDTHDTVLLSREEKKSSIGTLVRVP